MSNPCNQCPKKGCVAYHDICPDYQKWVKEEREKKELKRKAKISREFVKSSTFKSRTNGQFRSHMK